MALKGQRIHILTIYGHTNQGAPTAPSQQLRAIGTAAQLFNISANGKKCARLEAHPSGLREL